MSKMATIANSTDAAFDVTADILMATTTEEDMSDDQMQFSMLTGCQVNGMSEFNLMSLI